MCSIQLVGRKKTRNSFEQKRGQSVERKGRAWVQFCSTLGLEDRGRGSIEPDGDFIIIIEGISLIFWFLNFEFGLGLGLRLGLGFGFENEKIDKVNLDNVSLSISFFTITLTCFIVT